jgi:hypothetical protein
MGFFNIFKEKENSPQNNNRKYQEIYDAIVKDFTDSGYIKQELLPQFFEKIKNNLFSKGYSDLFSYDDCLTLDEKKNLGIPTRQKISREMINSLSPEGKKLPDPKRTLEGIYNHHSSKINRKYELLDMKNELSSYNDFLLGYRVIAAIDDSTCIFCGALDGTLLKTVKDVEDYEKNKCLKNVCRCIFVPVMKGDGKQTGPTYAGWFRKLSVEDKKEILGEYYERFKNGESLKDITFSLTEEEALKYFQDRKAREKLREQEEAKKPKVKEARLPKLTEEQLQEYRELLIKKSTPGDWISVPGNLDTEIDVMKRRVAKEQHIILDHLRKTVK